MGQIGPNLAEFRRQSLSEYRVRVAEEFSDWLRNSVALVRIRTFAQLVHSFNGTQLEWKASAESRLARAGRFGCRARLKWQC